jgi:hypothetical protein
LGLQALVISPGLFLGLLGTAGVAMVALWRGGNRPGSEGELLLLLLFLPVFLMYAVLSWHIRCEPNWPAVSYLTLIIIMASLWKRTLATTGKARPLIIIAFGFAWLQTLILHDPEFLHLPQKLDPMGRIVGWSEIAAHLADLREEQHADVFIADGYKEASVFSFHLPDKAFIYALRHVPPSNQFDFWPGYMSVSPQRALWITSEPDASALRSDFNTITPLERVVISFHDKPFREYTIYQCENR